MRTRLELGPDRVIDCIDEGDGSTAFLFVGGTPGGVVAAADDIAAVRRRGLRFVLFGRPGYGDSTRRPGRSVADVVDDTRAVLSALGVERAYVAGASGGGPHALAIAALAPDLVISAATIAGVAPVDAEGLDWLAGMGRENIEEFGAASSGPDALEGYLTTEAAQLATIDGPSVAAAMGDLLPPVDVAALTGEMAETFAASVRDALRCGIWGWYDDDLAITRPWGFDLAAIRVPVMVWQGSEDRMVPFAHGRWLADHVPGARARLIEGEGHVSIAAGDGFERILDDLVVTPA